MSQRKPQDITGMKWGMLTAVAFSHSLKGRSYWLFKCDCGKQAEKILANVQSGGTRSCGHLQREAISATGKSNRTHGYTSRGATRKGSEFRSWESMKRRCLNPKHKYYKYYGARGITIDSRWLNSFENFIDDMGKKPTLEHTLDRINNQLGYSRENCRWATKKEQANNRKQRQPRGN